MGYNTQEIYKSNSDFLKAEDIGNAMPVVVVSDVELKEFDNGDKKLALHFQGKEKILPLNKTNAGTMESLYGYNTDGWLNQRIMLFTMPVDFNGKKTQAIRIRAPQGFVSGTPQGGTQSYQAPAYDGLPPSPPIEAYSDMDDEIPF